MNNFFTRSITALFFAFICITSIYVDGFIHILFFLFSILALTEYLKMVFPKRKPSSLFLSVFLGSIMFISIFVVQRKIADASLLWINIFSIASVFIYELYQKNKNPFENIALLISGFVYVIIPFSLFCGLGYLTGSDYSYQIPLGFILLLWASDTGAYLFGMALGKHRLFERISPKKSWEGFFGGMLTAALFAYLISNYFNDIPTFHWIMISIIVVIFGTLGDLVESMLKRSKDIKDSGNILPGHGGILDRFDGLLIAAPLVYAYLSLFL